MDTGLQIALGCHDGITFMNKFGANSAVGTSYEDIWNPGALWVPLPAATVLDVSSSHADDTLLGDGLRTLHIFGLDANYEEISEIVEMDGLTPVQTENIYLFVNRVHGDTGGVDAVNAGDIYVADDSTAHTDGVPNTAAAIQSKIVVGEGQSQLARYTVPAGKRAFMGHSYVIASANLTVVYRLVHWENLNSIKHILLTGSVTDDHFTKSYVSYPVIPEKTTLLWQAKVLASSGIVSAGFDLILVDKTKFGLR
jgi:hypothetical protein